jgi:hypothetical protein
MNRPHDAWLPLTLDDLPGRFERLYREGRAWREEQGFSDAEAGRFLLAQLQHSG